MAGRGEQAKADRLPLDIPRLKASFHPDGDAYPALLLFDGIDEVGGPDTRNQIIRMADDARRKGFRVLVTGRPNGFKDLQPDKLSDDRAAYNVETPSLADLARADFSLYYLLPFAWEQIEYFIRHWYLLRDEWKRQRETGIESFLNALRDPRRPYLLTLARRPIFLSLMALVHCSDNEMPDGRGKLYARIVDLYLGRQDRQRRLKQQPDGTPMPRWPDTEKRMALGYLAWRSQLAGSENKDDDDKDERRVIWKKEEMLEAIRRQIEGGQHGRFTAIQPGDAPALLNYFLYPAGLLVEPAEGQVQFAHLSFQEYLCAEFLYGRARVKGLKNHLETQLFNRLGQPGWIEVGLLLLTLHAEGTQNEGHFEVLGWLDPSDEYQAELLMGALTGRELPFSDEERKEWLPILMGTALVHPDADFVKNLSRLPESVSRHGVEILQKLFEAESDAERWAVLLDTLRVHAHWTG